MRHGLTRVSVVLAAIALSRSASAQEPPPDPSAQPAAAASPWLLVPVFSSSPKLGTALGGLGAYLHKFDDSSRVSLFGVSYQYTSTNSQVLSGFARTSFGRDHHRVVLIAVFGQIKNDYDDYLGTGQPLKTDDNLKALAARYLWRAKGDWFIGGQLSAANYQVLGATAEDDLLLETLGVRGANSAGFGANLMHDSRDNEDRPTKGWFMNVNNLAYREALGGDDSYEAYRADLRAFWKHGGGNVLAIRQYNWLTSGAPSASQATVTLRGYKQGQYLSPYMSSLEVEERWAFNERWGATLFGGVAALYGNAPVELDRTTYPDIGAGVHFVLKPEAHMLVNLEYAQGIGDRRPLSEAWPCMVSRRCRHHHTLSVVRLGFCMAPRVYALSLLLSIATLGRASAQVLTLDSCQVLARSNYPLVRQYELIEKTREFTLSNASKAYLPQLSVTAIGAHIFGDLPSFGSDADKRKPVQFIGLAQLNQSIWDGGATRAQKKVISASSDADKAALDVSLYELRSRVNQLYFGILLVDEQLGQLVAQDAILGNNVNRIKQLSDNGLAYTTDLDELKVEQLKLNQQRVELRYVRRGYARMLSLLIGEAIGEDVKLPKPAVDTQKPDLTISRPELSLYARQRTLVDAQLSLQQTGLKPKIGLLGAGVLIEPGIALGNQTTSWLGVAGLSISWGIGGLYRRGNDKGLAQASLSRIGLQEETFLFNTNLAATQASENIEKLRAILAEDDDIVRLRQAIRESHQMKYTAGSGPLIDLLNATEQERGARSQQSLHEMQLLVAIVEQRTITGH